MLEWNVNELEKYRDKPYKFDLKLDLNDSICERCLYISHVSSIYTKGYIKLDNKIYITHFSVKTKITVPSTRSLSLVKLPINFIKNDVFAFNDSDVSSLNNETVILIKNNIISLKKAIEDYIILSVPTQVFTKEEIQKKVMPSGNGWDVISEEDYNKKRFNERHNPFLKLDKNIFN